ncbi:MAG: uracil-DNA glycosylase [Alphaproteobacteria bacterium]|nr:uracil-DNA glycosylase [Alphaproteobacteria bacterium]MBU1525421.1 uracil-DNA glycosylase [Alphaproteobacteria bacterium]MBU2351118.1 uracil-DNA glycosylase [Alphaproteobacteria bacterium]
MIAPAADSRAVEALMAFWADAGVDACFADAAVDRLRPIAPAGSAQKPAAGATRPLRVAATSGVADAVAEARRAAAAALDLEQLEAAIAAFTGCPLSTTGARRAVFARGEPAGGLLIVGEGPGGEEDARGQPFVGKAGQLLDRMLEAAGLSARAFITNTVYWRPPGNRTPTPEEQAVCAPFLERTFELIRPAAVLTLGAAAARQVLKSDEGITRSRGAWGEWRLAEGDVSAPVMPTLHPAFLLRQPQAKREVWADLLEVAARLDAAP